VTLARGGRVLGILVVAVAATAFGPVSGPLVIEIPPGAEVSHVILAVPEGSVIRLLPGTHGPFVVGRNVTVEGTRGASVGSPVVVAADGAVVRDLVIVGGQNGVSVDRAEGVVLEGLTVRDASMHGIEISEGSATVTDCLIEVRGPYAQGIEVRNSTGHPRSAVRGCRVSGGREGLLTHVARAEFVGNEVSGTSLRGIAVTEMSEGLIEDNEIHDVAGTAVYCGDMSHCEIRDNVVRGVVAAPGAGRSAGGYGAVAWYFSRVRVAGNSFEGLEGPGAVRVTLGSTRTDVFPLSIWPAGWRGALPGLGVAAVALSVLGLVRLGLTPFLRRRRRHPAARGEHAVAAGAVAVLLAGLVVQSFHMLEHVVQVIQINVEDAEVRRGLAGAVFDTEWVHFAYNLAVLVFLVWAWRMTARLDRTWDRAATSYGFVLAALVIQTYHLAEHVAKILQHVTTGLDPAPGLIGDQFGLVWFHFGINLAVYSGFVIAVAPLLVPAIRDVVAPRVRLAEASA
jgi:parallel beta helix pectate lyase-like protein